ncbi:DUF6932 family protein [Ruania rhizosphaerae]|uniref:DUF6932 family protein n=1 Tax=Ruania rhizosphaerae TaxID=1840413 RepID=UPI001356F9CE|nr:hypothetical protein [Ruania rhizosphaerae]
MVLEFTVDGRHMEPGRTRLSWYQAKEELVEAERFVGSETRSTLWEGLEQYVARFLAIEEEHQDRLAGRPLVHYLWLGGSFVSAKHDPRNIDATVCVDGPAKDALKGVPRGASQVNKLFSRERVLEELGVSPIELLYRPVRSVFRLDELGSPELDYLRQRGGWDDWWQRCRMEGEDSTPEPTVESAPPKRGYVEVTL